MIYNQLPLGHRIPDTHHGVSVSLPTMRDVMGYEEKDPATMSKITTGYPRFVKHAFIETLEEQVLVENQLDPLKSAAVFLASETAANDAIHRLTSISSKTISRIEYRGIPTLLTNKGSETEIFLKKYLQHTGTGLSSRQAEDLLKNATENSSQSANPDTQPCLQPLLENWFSPSVTSSIYPCKSGMNAFYSVFQAVNEIQVPLGRKNWISVGWLYLDTMDILNQFLEADGQHKAFLNPDGTDAIIEYIENHGHEIAGMVLEAPTNPLGRTTDVERIDHACQKAGILTIMDPSLVSPQNVDLSPYCDIVCCSLTKYAAYAGDVMVGAVSINAERPHHFPLENAFKKHVTPVYQRDLDRLKDLLQRAPEKLDVINANTMKMAAYFESHPAISAVHWPYHPIYRKDYEKIQRKPESPGGVISIELKQTIGTVYDAIPLPKGPSFGTEFTLICPYIHIAHYDLLQSENGRNLLRSADLSTNMLRISIGTENVDELKAVFEQVL